ncbi:MAG TPA: hypothetical protein VED66_07200 [Candidatus Sulfotelmatobacter sp.]|nr:hypothetical protein [Candidatus Sulfotelmatobacter sp.]
MKLPSPRPKILLALPAFLAAIFACASFSCAQNGPAPRAESETPPSAADPAFLARANATLIHARKLIDSFFEQTSNVVCTENVSQTIIGKNNKPLYREESAFEYQLQSNSRSGSLRLVESREARKAAFRDPNKTLLITNGFASMLLILHPNYEPSYAFEPLGEETIDGRTLVKLHFKPVPGAASPAAIQLRGRNYPLPLKGDIWIDEQSGAVVRLISSLDGGLDDLGLHDLRSEIHYSIVQFHEPEEAYWMPASAVIDVETPKQHWRNVHRFTDYKRFRATIQVELGDKKP